MRRGLCDLLEDTENLVPGSINVVNGHLFYATAWASVMQFWPIGPYQQTQVQ